MNDTTTPIQVNPGDVWQADLQAGTIQVRAWPDDMPESGREVHFAERRWTVTRRNVRTEGGRACYIAVLLP